MGGMDSEYLPLHAPTGPHPLRAFSPQVLTFMTRHGPFDHSFFAVRFAVRFGATQSCVAAPPYRDPKKIFETTLVPFFVRWQTDRLTGEPGGAKELFSLGGPGGGAGRPPNRSAARLPGS